MEKQNPMSVTVIGLGMLGTVLAGAFLKAGHRTSVWNRSTEKTSPLVEKGAIFSPTLAEAVLASNLVVVCVSTYETVYEILNPVRVLLSGRVLLNLSSGTPEQAREMSAWAAELGADYLDGAAMGGTRLVGQPEALFLYSGSPSAFTAYESVLTSLGTATYLGASADSDPNPDPGLASLYDTALFSLIWGTLTSFYHGIALVGAENVDPPAFAAVATNYLSYLSWVMTDHARQIESGHYPGDDGTLEIHAGAMEHLLHTSRTYNLNPALPDFMKTLIEQGLTAGYGANSIASIFEVIKNPLVVSPALSSPTR